MADYDLYEVVAPTLEDARKLVEQGGISLEERESSYHRGVYFSYGQIGGENFELKVNLDPYEEQPMEEDFPNSKFLLYINNTNRSELLKSTFSQLGNAVVMIRHENFS